MVVLGESKGPRAHGLVANLRFEPHPFAVEDAGEGRRLPWRKGQCQVLARIHAVVVGAVFARSARIRRRQSRRRE